MRTEYYTSNIMIFLAVAAALVVVIVLIILFLYNHKSNAQTKAINEIDRHITNGDLIAKVKFEGQMMPGAAETAPDDAAVPAAEDGTAAGQNEISDGAGIAAAMMTAEEKERERWERKRFYNVGKSGRVYSREELETLIKD